MLDFGFFVGFLHCALKCGKFLKKFCRQVGKPFEKVCFEAGVESGVCCFLRVGRRQFVYVRNDRRDYYSIPLERRFVLNHSVPGRILPTVLLWCIGQRNLPYPICVQSLSQYNIWPSDNGIFYLLLHPNLILMQNIRLVPVSACVGQIDFLYEASV